MEKYFGLFELKKDADWNDVKKAYRKLVKRNHPDLFQGQAKKSEQEAVMKRLNEAYQALAEHFKKGKKSPVKTDKPDKDKTENDTVLYKKGVEFFGKYQGSISLKFPQYTRFDKESILEKEKNLKEAAKYFKRVLDEFPESDWTFDSEERLNKIAKIMKNLVDKGSNTETLPRDDANFYFNKFRKTFRGED